MKQDSEFYPVFFSYFSVGSGPKFNILKTRNNCANKLTMKNRLRNNAQCSYLEQMTKNEVKLL